MVTRSSNRNTPTTDYYQVYTMSQYAAEFSPSQYFSLFGEFSGRKHVDGGTSNIFFNGYAHYYLQMKQFSVGTITFPRQTLAVNLSTLLTKDIDAPFQTSLGENEGLRGYTFKSFTGQNRLLFNVENRIFTPLDFRVVGIGLAAFLDAGYVWTSEEHLSFNDLGVSAGIGLRIGLKKSQSAKVIRVDLAFPLRDETTRFTDADRKGYSISVSSGHIFNAIEALPKLFQLF
jgi:hemolysin activation/secretion protein